MMTGDRHLKDKRCLVYCGPACDCKAGHGLSDYFTGMKAVDDLPKGLSPLPGELHAAKQRLIEHLEVIEGYNEASTVGGLFTQQDKDIMTILRALGVKI